MRIVILLKITHKENPPNNIEFQYVASNNEGGFHLEYDLPVEIFDMRRAGYVSKGGGTTIAFINQEEANNITIEMIPKDGFLKLIFENTTTQPDSVYAAIYSPSQYSEATISKGVILREGFFIQNTTPYYKVINLASEENIDIYWGFSPLPFNLASSPFHNSVFIPRNDTTSFAISF